MNTDNQIELSLIKRSAELTLLSSIQNALLTQKEMQFIFELVGLGLQEMFEGFVVSIAMLDKEAGTEHFTYHFEEEKKALPEPRPYNKIRQVLINTKKQLVVNEKAISYVNELIGQQYFKENDIEIPKSFLFTPLLIDGEVNGYISLKHYKTETVFDEAHIQFLNTVAGSISVTLQNERLIFLEQQKAAEQKALLETMQDLSSKLELDTLLQSVVQRSADLLKVTGGELAIYNSSSKELEIVASYNLGMESIGLKLQLGEGAMGTAAMNKETLIIPDYQTWASKSSKYTATKVHCVMVVPLMIKDQLVGTLCSVHLDKSRQFEESDLRLLNLFAPLAATAIDNARLFEAERKRADEQKALLETMQDLSGKLELTTLLQSVVKRSVDLLQVTGGELAIYHPEDKQLEIVASLNLGMESFGLRLELGEGAMGTAAANKETLIIPDYQTWASKSSKYASTKVHSVMVVPLMIKDQLVGALCSVHLEKDREFNQKDIQLLQLFAPLAATAIDNARLFNKTNKLLEEAEQRTAELKNTQHQLIQQEKLASLGELTAGIAHEIQNPLNFVNNFSEVSAELVDEMNEEITKGNLEDASSIANDLKQNLQKINHHGKRADAIVKGMLQHSRSSSGVKEPTNINALTEEYVRLCYHGLRAKDNTFNATIDTNFDKSIGKINIIPQDIGRVILNLITNAFYVVNEKKNSGIANYEPTVWVSTKKVGEKVLVSVKDNGNGIPQKILDKIFQPFFTTKPTGQGTGLGLSLSYDIVKAHGGELKVETKEGEGSEFFISIPI
ncbi:MAG: GAF domain-containing protein [Sphingobacteriia bacterium]|jgi:signal transduction histidine kinase